MKRILLIVLGAIVIGGGLFVYWAYINIVGDWETDSWNQKLTVTVETPDGNRSGAAITHVDLKFLKPGSKSISSASAEEQSAGEAVVVALPEGRYLFVLRAETPSALPQSAFLDTLLTESERDKLYYIRDFYRKLADSNGLSGTLPVRSLPRLVTFGDLSDPTSVTLVDPNNLAASFGPGYALKGVAIEITKEQIEFGKVGAVLGDDFFRKAATIQHEALDRGLPDPYFDTLLSKLSRGDFIRD